MGQQLPRLIAALRYNPSRYMTCTYITTQLPVVFNGIVEKSANSPHGEKQILLNNPLAAAESVSRAAAFHRVVRTGPPGAMDTHFHHCLICSPLRWFYPPPSQLGHFLPFSTVLLAWSRNTGQQITFTVWKMI